MKTLILIFGVLTLAVSSGAAEEIHLNPQQIAQIVGAPKVLAALGQMQGGRSLTVAQTLIDKSTEGAIFDVTITVGGRTYFGLSPEPDCHVTAEVAAKWPVEIDSAHVDDQIAIKSLDCPVAM